MHKLLWIYLLGCTATIHAAGVAKFTSLINPTNMGQAVQLFNSSQVHGEYNKKKALESLFRNLSPNAISATVDGQLQHLVSGMSIHIWNHLPVHIAWQPWLIANAPLADDGTGRPRVAYYGQAPARAAAPAAALPQPSLPLPQTPAAPAVPQPLPVTPGIIKPSRPVQPLPPIPTPATPTSGIIKPSKPVRPLPPLRPAQTISTIPSVPAAPSEPAEPEEPLAPIAPALEAEEEISADPLTAVQAALKTGNVSAAINALELIVHIKQQVAAIQLLLSAVAQGSIEWDAISNDGKANLRKIIAGLPVDHKKHLHQIIQPQLPVAIMSYLFAQTEPVVAVIVSTIGRTTLSDLRTAIYGNNPAATIAMLKAFARSPHKDNIYFVALANVAIALLSDDANLTPAQQLAITQLADELGVAAQIAKKPAPPITAAARPREIWFMDKGRRITLNTVTSWLNNIDDEQVLLKVIEAFEKLSKLQATKEDRRLFTIHLARAIDPIERTYSRIHKEWLDRLKQLLDSAGLHRTLLINIKEL